MSVVFGDREFHGRSGMFQDVLGPFLGDLGSFKSFPAGFRSVPGGFKQVSLTFQGVSGALQWGFIDDPGCSSVFHECSEVFMGFLGRFRELQLCSRVLQWFQWTSGAFQGLYGVS